MEDTRLPLSFRVLHWALALFVILNFFFLEGGGLPHRMIGYAAFAAVLSRLAIQKKRPSHYNPKAVIVYGLIWLSVILQAATGFLMSLDRFWGNQTLQDTHELTANTIMLLVILHLVGVFWDAFREKRKTWMIMINGEKYARGQNRVQTK
jgi:cytochrome b